MKFKFIDEATIKVLAGKGGDGCASFRREKFIEFGGPDGGDGGRGGNVILEASRSYNTLTFFRYRGVHKACHGRNGMSKGKAGARGSDLVLFTPLGTHVIVNGEEVCELSTHGQRFMIAKGGDSGAGNIHYKSSTNQRPMNAGKGKPGEEVQILLSLRSISDVGIIGKPNCGKSTLLNTITDAYSKTGDYCFTTTRPHLGVVADDFATCVIADIPGLIDGASEGLGCGHIFLRHVEKCTLLLHMIDASKNDVLSEYTTVRDELTKYDAQYGTQISEKKEIVVLNKADLVDEESLEIKKRDLGAVTSLPVILSLLDADEARSILAAVVASILEEIDATKSHSDYAPISGY